MNLRLLLLLLPVATGNAQTPESGLLTDTTVNFPVVNSIRSCIPPTISYWQLPPTLFSESAISTCLFVVDSTPYRRIDSLKHAVDSICLLHQNSIAAQSGTHQKAIMREQTKAQQLESALLRYKKLCYTALVLILALLWMLFRVRRAAMRVKPLVLPHESAHEPTPRIS